MSGSRFERAALDLAARGYHVFPCVPRTKKPLTDNGFKDASRDERTILRWWDRWPDANIGVACGASGLVVLDVDSKHGADPADVVSRLGLEHHPVVVITGEAPEITDKLPNSLPGVRGAQLWFRGDTAATRTSIPGVEIRRAGHYVLAPPSVHPSGVPYDGDLPDARDIPDMPARAHALTEDDERNPAPVVGDKIEHGQQHYTLVSLAGTMRRRGMGQGAIAAALKEVNRTRCEVPGTDADMDRIARSMLRYEPKDVPRSDGDVVLEYDLGQNGREQQPPPYRDGDGGDGREGHQFSLRQLRAENIRPTSWAHAGYLVAGALNGLVGVGGAGKGTWMAWEIARWTKGELPGHLEGKPARVLVVGDEDSADEVWTPRIAAADGDVEQVFTFDYDTGVALDLVRHIGELERHVRERDIAVIYLDAVLDHISVTLSSHVQKDVRVALAPVRSLARRLGCTVVYSMHPNKAGGTLALRNRAGGSGQFIDLPRSGLILGYHPDEPGRRALARGKGNLGETPPALTFSIETAFVTNPKTGEVVDVGVVAGLEQEPGLLSEDINSHPPSRSDEPTQTELAQQVLRELAADGDKHPRAEGEQACKQAGISERTFDRAFSTLDKETEHRGREVWWWLPRRKD